ncbi:MAG TPA: S8 family serine peptidase, partial [Roseiflexaceae bacterium]|nr:S8 family serine peptidase [Roseiflexaceae bacterium]
MMCQRYQRLWGQLTVVIALLGLIAISASAHAVRGAPTTTRPSSGVQEALVSATALTPDTCVADGQGRCRNEVLVKLTDPTALPIISAALQLTLIDQLEGRPIYRLRLANPLASLDGVLAALLANPLVVYAEANYLGEEPEGIAQSSWSRGDNDDTGYRTQWAPDKIRLPDAHTVSRGAGVTVAVLDTGADLDHPALAGRLVQGVDFVDGDLDPSEEGVYGQDIAFGHGTHVAGLIALAAPDAKIMPLRILKPDGSGNSWLLAQAIRYATDYRVGVINLSYSVKHRSLLIDEVLSDVTSAQPGAVVAAAAGNSGGTAPEYPAAEGVPGLLAVAASTISDNLAVFSTRGAWVSVAAPGDRIVSSVPLSSGSAYATWSGTSMAAPLTAG